MSPAKICDPAEKSSALSTTPFAGTFVGGAVVITASVEAMPA